MEIKTVGDLIPYRQSLLELWGKEEFQPVLALLCSIKEEAVTSFRILDRLGEEDAVQVKAKLAVARSQYNLAAMLEKLPDVIKETENQIQQTQAKKLAVVQAQEKGEI